MTSSNSHSTDDDSDTSASEYIDIRTGSSPPPPRSRHHLAMDEQRAAAAQSSCYPRWNTLPIIHDLALIRSITAEIAALSVAVEMRPIETMQLEAMKHVIVLPQLCKGAHHQYHSYHILSSNHIYD